MPLSKRLSTPLIFFLLFYLVALAGLGSYLFWPKAQQAPLRVTRASLAPKGDRILLEGEGFSAATQVSLSLDVNNRRFLRHTVPTWGPGEDIVRVGRFAYATNREMGLLILDLTEPDRPRVVGTLKLPGQARTLTVEAGVAFVACGRTGVALVDVSEPSAPRLLNTLPELSMTQGLAVQGGRLYTTLFGSGVAPALAVSDVSDPRKPEVLGQISLPGQPIGVAIRGNRLFVAAVNEGCLELELGAGLPRIRSRLPLAGSARSVKVIGEHAFIACAFGGLAVVELKSEAPRLLMHLPIPGNVNHLTVEQGRLYLADAAGGGHVVDVENPEQPILLGAFPAPRSTLGIAALGRWIYLNTFQKGIQVFDLAEPTPLQRVAQLDLGGKILSVNQEKDLLVVTTLNGNLQLLENANGAAPRLAATLALKGASYYLEIHNGHVYARLITRDIQPTYGTPVSLGLEVVNIRNIQEPFQAGFYPTEGGKSVYGESNSFALAGEHDALVVNSGKVIRIKTTEPGAGELLPGPEVPEAVGKIAADDNMLFLASREGGSLRPVELLPDGSYKIYPEFFLPAQGINQMQLLGPVVLAACGLEGLVIVDFTAPSAPRLLAILSLPISADQLKLDGTTAYVGASAGGILGVDLSDPAHPRIGALLADSPSMGDFAVSGDHAFVAAGSAGLLVVPLPQTIQPLRRSEQQMTLALPPIDTAGYYSLRLTDGTQTVDLPGALVLGTR